VSFHSLLIKNKARNGAVLNGTADFLLPLDVQRNRGRNLRSPVFTDFSSSKKHQKDADQGPLLAHNFPRVGGAVEEQQHSGRPVVFLPYFLPIKTREGRAQKGGEKWKTEEKQNEEREQKRRKTERKRRRRSGEENEKQRRERDEKNRAAATTANRQRHCLSPPAATACQPFSPSFFSCFVPATPPLFTLVGPSLAHVVGPGLAHFKKTIKRKKIYFSIFVISPPFDLCFFLLNIDLYFIS
jgi:hypothetical protein